MIYPMNGHVLAIFLTAGPAHSLLPAVHFALYNLKFNYNTSSFLKDLPGFRKKTFTPKLIISAF